MDWKLTDENRVVRLTLSNGALTHRTGTDDAPLRGSADLTLTMTKPQLVNLVLGKSEGVAFDGDHAVLSTLVGLLDTPDPRFPIVTP